MYSVLCGCNTRGRIEQEFTRAEIFHCGEKEKMLQYQALLVLISSVEHIARMDSNSISRSIRTITQAEQDIIEPANMSNITMNVGDLT